MRPDYKNWVPKGMVIALGAAAAAALLLLLAAAAGAFGGGTLRTVLLIVFAAAAIGFGCGFAFCMMWYRAFSYNGKRQLSRAIIEGVAEFVELPEGGLGLDVGCGSGALTIACARRNPQARMLGVDRWGKEYASFSKALCERNAAAEGVPNVRFERGDAIRLDYPDETFDAVTSNYVYHNIAGRDKQELLRETLRVLRKGGTFAIHDLMSPARYGDMEAFLADLRAQGYERAECIDTTQGRFLQPGEARRLMLSGSALLIGKK